MATELRPLTIGAILDRAVSLYVRHIVAFLAAFAVYWIPVAIAQAVLAPASAFDVRHLLSLPVPNGTAPPAQTGPSMMQSAAMLPLLLLSVILGPIGNNAVLLTALGFLDGTVVPLADALRGAARRWLPTIVVSLLFAGLAIAAAIAVVVMAFAPIALATAFRGSGFGLAIIIATAVVLILFFVLGAAVLFVAMGMAYVVVVAEDPNPVRAFSVAMRRAFDRGLRVRTLLVGLAYGAVEMAGLIVFTAGAYFIAALVHSAAVAAVFSTLGESVVGSFGLVFVLLYTRDVRVRREGADLLLALETTP